MKKMKCLKYIGVFLIGMPIGGIVDELLIQWNTLGSDMVALGMVTICAGIILFVLGHPSEKKRSL